MSEETTAVAQGLARELRHSESVASAWKAQYEELQAAIRTPFASILTHEAALERLREINRLSYGATS